jgi:hypothetical protein
MNETMSTIVTQAFQRTHGHVLEAAEGLSQVQLTWRPGPIAPPIAFHVWHLARWADFLQEILSVAGSQLWVQEGLAVKWGLREDVLGYAETGMGMGDDASANLTLPAKVVLLDYARQAFELADHEVAKLDPVDFDQGCASPRAAEYFGGEPTLGYVLLRELRHENRHLGMIECLRGIQGLR